MVGLAALDPPYSEATMLDVLLTRWKQGYRTMRYPAGPPPDLPERFAGRPSLEPSKCAAECRALRGGLSYQRR